MAKVLVAEDQRRIRELLVDMLTYGGHEVIEAEDGGVALERARRDHPDLILLDVMMPVMDGFEVLKGLRRNFVTEETPVILLTALDPEEGEKMALGLGVEHYLTKPLETGMVAAAVKVALRGSSNVRSPVKAGISQLDGKLGGGIPSGSLTLIEGASSSGKSVLCQHLVHGALELGHRVASFTSEDGSRSLVSQMGSIGLPVSGHVRTGNLRVVPMHEPGAEEQGWTQLSRLVEEMDRVPKEHKVITVDSITSLAGISDEQAIAKFFAHCKRLCGARKTIILVVHSFALDERMLSRLRSLCEAHLKLSVENIGEKQVRVMEVTKIHSANQTTGNLVSFEVEPGFGMKILPYSKAKA